MSDFVLGVGGIVICEDRVLMVQHNYGMHDGYWLLPGGHVHAGENLDAAVEREVWEETGIKARATAVVAVRSRIREDCRLEVYIVFLMEYLAGKPRLNPRENQNVAFLSWNELESIERVTALSREIVKAALAGACRRLDLHSAFPLNSPDYRLYL